MSFAAGFLGGALTLLVIDALALIVIYVLWLRASSRPGQPPAYTLHTYRDNLADGHQPVSPALADWADARLEAAGLVLTVSRRYAPLRVSPYHVAFWAEDELSWLRIGITFVSRDDTALVNLHAPLDPIL